MNPYQIEANQETVSVRFTDISAPWEQWIFLRSDVHHDSVLCNRELEYAHLNKAKARDALVLEVGDTFDAMQGTHDRRSSKSEIRPEYLTQDYFGALIRHTAEEYQPYAKNFLEFAKGNHETSVLKHSNICLLSQLAHELNRAGGNVQVGGYDGWVRFMFTMHTNVRQTIRLRYFHGAGASAQVTRGMIDTNRQAVNLVNADIVLNGHNHKNYVTAIGREFLSAHGDVRRDLMWFVRTPGYKFRGDWEREKGHANEPHGGCWLRFYLDSEASQIRFDLTMELS